MIGYQKVLLSGQTVEKCKFFQKPIGGFPLELLTLIIGLFEILRSEQPGIIRSFLPCENTGQLGEHAAEFGLTNLNLHGGLMVLNTIYLPRKEKTRK